MAFYDYSFLFAFLPLVLAIYYLIPSKLRNIWFLIASLVFYFFADFAFLPVLILAALVNYFLGFFLSRAKSSPARKLILVFGVIFDLGLLCSFKYLGFFAQTIRLIPEFSHVIVPRAALPIGISFYTFTSLSYLIDLYRGQVQPARSLWDFSSFLTMFPHIVSGPIVRFREIRDQIEHRSYHFTQITQGIALFFMGFCKKILLADTAAYFCDPLYSLAAPGFIQAWMSVLLFCAQMYFDFSGYTDMAIGLALLLGLEYPQNFDSPHKAATVTEFWRRWHMTLMRWLRDYLYIPLGGNRKGGLRTYFNLMATFVLGGLWHGASWNFVVWGAYHGVLLCIERMFGIRVAPKGLLARLIRTGVTFILVALGLGVFFRCKTLGQSGQWIKSIFFMQGMGPGVTKRAVGALAALLAIIFIPKNSWQKRSDYRLWWVIFLTACFGLSVIVAFSKGGMPFLYARF
jgi:alginate O-acetyltransferase complex protein AlgI